MAPCKGPHIAIEVAKRVGMPLKLAGEVQPLFQDYWEREVLPHVDGRNIEYIGEADAPAKDALLGGARALLFPIQWSEPFGLVMIEAMACGTPVVALTGGSVAEVVGDAGILCESIDDMVRAVRTLDVPPLRCRKRVESRFSVDAMARQYARLYSAASKMSRAAAARPTVTMQI
jgi:glycosyltransferase involved in cell wall biosynthesis